MTPFGATAAFLAGHRATRVAPLTDRLVETIQAQNPDYRGAAVVPLADLVDSCRANIARVLELLAATVDVEAGGSELLHYYDAARETGRRRAEQGLPLDAVLRSFRLGGRLIWEDLHEQGRGVLDLDALREVGTRLWVVVDQTSAQVALAYHATERAMVRDDEQRRAALWEGVLGGRPQDPLFAQEAARILDLPMSGELLVVVLDLADGAGTGGVADDLAAAGVRSTFVRRPGAVVGVLDLAGVPASRALALVGAGCRCGVGAAPVVHRLSDVATAFGQAGLALRSLAGQAGVAAYDERLADVLLLTAPEVTERLVGVWLRPLLELPGQESEQLVDTLSAWVDTGGSSVATAARVHCHRNTVGNRLRRVAALTGQPVGEGLPPLGLVLALRALRLRRS